MSDDIPNDDLKADIVQEPHFNFKGIFYDENHDKKHYEGGAHFSYKELFKRLSELTRSLTPDRVSDNNLKESINALRIKKFYDNQPKNAAAVAGHNNTLFKLKRHSEDFRLERDKFSYISPVKIDPNKFNTKPVPDLLDKLQNIKENSSRPKKINLMSPELAKRTISYHKRSE
jgi:hypothetical protein